MSSSKLTNGLIPAILTASLAFLARPVEAHENADALTFREIFFSTFLDGQLDGAFGSAVAPDGSDVYVSAPDAQCIARFRRNADGTLDFTGSTPVALQTRGNVLGAYGLVTSPNGKFVYAAVTNGGTFGGIARYDRNMQTGALAFGAGLPADNTIIPGIHNPYYLAQSPDGRHLYVLSDYYFNSPYYLPALAVVSTDPSTGAMAFVQKIDLTSGLPSGYGTFADVTVSPDGKNVYVARAFDESVDAYTRNTTTGELTFLGASYLRASPLGFVLSVAVSPDGKHIYATEGIGGYVYLLDRDADGRTSVRNGGAVSLVGPDRIAAAPDGERIYATSQPVFSSIVRGVNAYARDTQTGLLTLIESVADGVSGIKIFDGS